MYSLFTPISIVLLYILIEAEVRLVNANTCVKNILIRSVFYSTSFGFLRK